MPFDYRLGQTCPLCLFRHTLTSLRYKNYLVIGGASMENRDKISYLASNLFEKQTVQQYLCMLVIETDDEERVTEEQMDYSKAKGKAQEIGYSKAKRQGKTNRKQ